MKRIALTAAIALAMTSAAYALELGLGNRLGRLGEVTGKKVTITPPTPSVLLINTGSALLINTGSKFLIHN